MVGFGSDLTVSVLETVAVEAAEAVLSKSNVSCAVSSVLIKRSMAEVSLSILVSNIFIFPFAYLVWTLYDDVQRYATGKLQMKKMLTSSQIALQIGVTKNTVIKMAKAGQIPSIRIGSGHYRFDIDDVKLALNTGGVDK